MEFAELLNLSRGWIRVQEAIGWRTGVHGAIRLSVVQIGRVGAVLSGLIVFPRMIVTIYGQAALSGRMLDGVPIGIATDLAGQIVDPIYVRRSQACLLADWLQAGDLDAPICIAHPMVVPIEMAIWHAVAQRLRHRGSRQAAIS